MGLDMKARRVVLREMASRYQPGRKKEKSKRLDEFCGLTGRNRGYAS